MRISSVEELPEPARSRAIAELEKQGGRARPSPGISTSRSSNKYRNQRVTVDGETFDSKLEYAGYCEQLERKRCGELLIVLRQVSFRLPGGVVYRCDYFTVLAAGGFEVIDAKGVLTRDFVNKAKQMRAVHAIEVLLWTKKRGLVPFSAWSKGRSPRPRKPKPTSAPHTPGATGGA